MYGGMIFDEGIVSVTENLKAEVMFEEHHAPTIKARERVGIPDAIRVGNENGPTRVAMIAAPI